ncbi:MAG: PmbA/TldA family metallopeptidase, partial [Phenylobacterium sp.]
MDVNLLNDIVAAALKAGADAAEAVGAEHRALAVNVRNGALEEVEREESRDLGLRVFVGQRQASVSGSDVSAEARAKLVERVVAMARLAPEDPYAGLADPERLARGPLPDLDLYDPAEPAPEALEERARTAEAAARAVPKVTNSDGGSASWSSSQWRMVTSAGFSGLHRASGFSISASAIAGDGDGMETGYDGRSVRWQSDLPQAAGIGTEAGARAAARLGARKIASTTAPVIFENRLAASLLSP